MQISLYNNVENKFQRITVYQEQDLQFRYFLALTSELSILSLMEYHEGHGRSCNQ